MASSTTTSPHVVLSVASSLILTYLDRVGGNLRCCEKLSILIVNSLTSNCLFGHLLVLLPSSLGPLLVVQYGEHSRESGLRRA